MSLVFDDRHEHRRDGLRWTAAALVVVALHLGGAVVLRHWQIPILPPEGAPPAVMVDLEPAPVPVPVAPAPEPAMEQIAPPPPEVVPPPPLPPEVVPEVVLPRVVPKPKPVARKHIEPPPVVTHAEPRVEPPAVPAPSRPAPASTAPPADAMNRFKQLLSEVIEREKRYPRLSQQRGEQGTVMLRFTMDRSGRVLAASIERGSGFAALDREVLEMIQRAQPLPAMPPEITASQLELVVSVGFALR